MYLFLCMFCEHITSYMQHVAVSQLESLTCIPTPGAPSLHLFHPGFVPGVGEVHQQHQLDQNKTESSTGAHDKPCCNNRDTQVSQLLYHILSELCILGVMIWVTKNFKYKVLTVGKRPIWNVKGTDCECHQGSKLEEPKSENKLLTAHYTVHKHTYKHRHTCNTF